MPEINITDNVLVRYASECDPKGTGGAKGGYLKGFIKVPECHPGEILKMEVSVCPTEKLEEKLRRTIGDQMRCPQPLMLRMVGKKRLKEWEPVPANYHWRMIFIIEGNNVRIINQISQDDTNNKERHNIPRNLQCEDTIVANLDQYRRIHLGGYMEGDTMRKLSIGVLKPKLERKGTVSTTEVTLRSVLLDMLDNSQDLTDQCERFFTSSNRKVNLTQFRLNVRFYKAPYLASPWMGTQSLHSLAITERLCEPVGEAVSQDILDTGEWALDLYYVFPLVSCLSGGHVVILLSEYDLKSDVKPIFQVYNDNNEPCALENKLSQPRERTEKRKHGDLGCYIRKKTFFILITPSQSIEVLQEIKAKNLKLKILIKRDKFVSQKKFDFEYLDTECSHNHNHQLPQIESARPYNSKRKVEEGKKEEPNSVSRPKINTDHMLNQHSYEKFDNNSMDQSNNEALDEIMSVIADRGHFVQGVDPYPEGMHSYPLGMDSYRMSFENL